MAHTTHCVSLNQLLVPGNALRNRVHIRFAGSHFRRPVEGMARHQSKNKPAQHQRSEGEKRVAENTHPAETYA